MASQRPVRTSVGCAWVQNTEPPLADRVVGRSWLNTATVPYLLETWDGANWVVQDYVTMSGQVGTAGYVASANLDKITFTTDSVASIITYINTHQIGAGVNNLIYGYAMGGYPSTTTIDRLTFSSEVNASITSTIAIAGFGAACSGPLAGYSLGGGGSGTTLINKLLFSSESVSSLVSGLSANITENGGYESSTSGYSLAGQIGISSLNGYIDRLVFAADTCSSISATLGAQRHNTFGGFASPTAGFITGGNDWLNTTYYTSIEKLLFATETMSYVVSGLLNPDLYSGAGGNNSRISGYITGIGGSNTNIDKLAFDTEITSSLMSTLTTPKGAPCSFDNLN